MELQNGVTECASVLAALLESVDLLWTLSTIGDYPTWIGAMVGNTCNQKSSGWTHLAYNISPALNRSLLAISASKSPISCEEVKL